ncbi:MAG: alpha/beta hydrolase [Candidatus Kariarchaeaceae archaeon]|jgi:carboxylesterase
MTEVQPFADERHRPFHFEGSNRRGALLVHGFPGTPAEMRMIGQILHEMGYTVNGILLPGFGSEINQLPEVGKDEWTREVEQAYTLLQSTCDDIIIVGYSFGAAVSLGAISRFDLKPSKIILIAPFWNVFGAYNIFIRIFGPLIWPIGRLFNPKMKVFESVDFHKESDITELSKTFEGLDLRDPVIQKFIKGITIPFSVLDELYKIGRDGKKFLRKVSFPVTILQGTKDVVVPPSSTAQLIQGVNLDYIELRGLDHHFIEQDSGHRELVQSHFSAILG